MKSKLNKEEVTPGISLGLLALTTSTAYFIRPYTNPEMIFQGTKELCETLFGKIKAHPVETQYMIASLGAYTLAMNKHISDLVENPGSSVNYAPFIAMAGVAALKLITRGKQKVESTLHYQEDERLTVGDLERQFMDKIRFRSSESMDDVDFRIYEMLRTGEFNNDEAAIIGGYREVKRRLHDYPAEKYNFANRLRLMPKNETIRAAGKAELNHERTIMILSRYHGTSDFYMMDQISRVANKLGVKTTSI
jgi:hypothetical protein